MHDLLGAFRKAAGASLVDWQEKNNVVDAGLKALLGLHVAVAVFAA